MTAHGDNPASTDVIRATSRGCLLSATLIALSIPLIEFFQLAVLPAMNASLDNHPAPHTIATLKYIFAGFAVLAILPAIVMIGVGRKMLKSGQWPPPGTWVWRDTCIRRGRDAARMAWVCIVSGTLTCILCLGLLTYIWTLFTQLASAPQLRPGVAILQQPFAATP
jgi:hypothetical protein